MFLAICNHSKTEGENRGHQIAKPNTDTIQYIVLFSHRTVQVPSVLLSQ